MRFQVERIENNSEARKNNLKKDREAQRWFTDAWNSCLVYSNKI